MTAARLLEPSRPTGALPHSASDFLECPPDNGYRLGSDGHRGLSLGDDRKSLELLENTLRAHGEAGRVQNYLVALANNGNVYLHKGNCLTAIDYFRRALELAREIKDPVSIRKWSGNIRLAYARLRESVDRLDSKTA